MLKFFASGALAVALLAGTSASAITLLQAIGGGYGQVTQPRNDDGSSGLLTLPFALNFYGQSHNSLYVNNNGNVTFSTPLSSFTPFNLGTLNQAMIAPYWADVDTRNPSSGQVYIGSFAEGQVNVTWDNVGYFSNHADKTNSFQMNLYQVGTNGDFDIEFRYADLNWTTGDASGGINGLGGVPAVAGFTNGDGIQVLQPGSFLSPGALNMEVESNVGEAGRWVYNIRNASPPPIAGSSPETPILPTGGSAETGYQFTFDIVPGRTYFIDPPVATGYDYSSTGGQLFTSARFDTLTGDLDGYSLFDLSGNLLFAGLGIGQVYNFTNPLAAFQLRGIDPAAMVDPASPQAFVSGFTFDTGGTATVTQRAIAEDYTPSAVPEPSTWAMMLIGFGVAGSAMRRSRRSVKVRFAG